MATVPQNIDVDKIMRPTPQAQKNILSYAIGILTKRSQFTQIQDKMDAIDVAYARYKAKVEKGTNGKDIREGDASCNVFAADDVTPPIVVSQVDAYVAYLSEVFLSGAPLFPVVSTSSKRIFAEQLESIIDDHAQLGGYARQLLMFLRDAAKYNFSAIETDWTSLDQFSVTDDLASTTASKIKRTAKKFTRITRLNPRNVVWDYAVAPGDIAENGDYAGHISRVSRIKLKRLLNKWSADGKALNVIQALNSSNNGGADGASANYREDPQISEYIPSNRNMAAGPDWDAYFDGRSSKGGGLPGRGSLYELFTFYARIMPSDFALSAPQPNTPQIWKFVICNNQHVVYANRVISAYDYLPILFGQPLEDGLGYQTQSIAEGEIPFQEAAQTLFNIRFAAARRAVSDRALYLPDAIKPSDINSPVAAPKIPVNLSVLSNKTISDVYHQIPFDMRGTETTIQDATQIVQFSKELHGLNGPRMGSFQKGNKSVKEWDDTMSGSEGRMRLPALTLEHQVFSPLKSILSLNLFQYGEDGTVTSQKTGQDLSFKIAEIRRANLSFKIADGYTPASKLAGTEILGAGMNLIMNAPILQQAFGASLPSMFIHFMSLGGLKGMEEYDPRYTQQQQQPLIPQSLTTNDPADTGQPQQPTGPVTPEGAQPAV